MLRVKHLLARKGHDIWSVEAEEPVLAALQIMADRHVGALPVLRNDNCRGPSRNATTRARSPCSAAPPPRPRSGRS